MIDVNLCIENAEPTYTRTHASASTASIQTNTNTQHTMCWLWNDSSGDEYCSCVFWRFCLHFYFTIFAIAFGCWLYISEITSVKWIKNRNVRTKSYIPSVWMVLFIAEQKQRLFDIENKHQEACSVQIDKCYRVSRHNFFSFISYKYLFIRRNLSSTNFDVFAMVDDIIS